MADKDMTWKTLSQKYLIEKPWLTARVDKVELPTGAIIDEYYVLEYPDWVNTIAITKDGMFVFVRQYRYAIGKTVNELCAGVIEKGEDPMVAAKRELMEETGFGGGNWQKWMTISANPSTHTNLTHCYLATDVERMDVQHLDQAEDIEILPLLKRRSNGYAGEGRNLAKPDGGSAMEVFCESKVSCRASFIKTK